MYQNIYTYTYVFIYLYVSTKHTHALYNNRNNLIPTFIFLEVLFVLFAGDLVTNIALNDLTNIEVLNDPKNLPEPVYFPVSFLLACQSVGCLSAWLSACRCSVV